MSIPFTNTFNQGARIGRQFPTAVAQPNRNLETISQQIISEYKNLNRKMIDSWRQALRAFNDPYFPRPYLIHDLYDDLSTDGHLKAQWLIRYMATLCYPFEIGNDDTGERDDETTKLFMKRWYFNFMKMALLYLKDGYRVLELINPITMEWKAIPGRNVIPSQKIVLKSVHDTTGIYYGEGYEDRIIEVGDPGDLGFMNDIVPQLIWKRNSQQSWAEFSEKFGMPLIVATTNKTNPKDLDKMEDILRSFGEAARALVPVGSTIDVKPFAGKDSFQVYDMQIERCNSEISKPIVGGTMTTDNGSSRSQSEVHERNLDDKITEGDRRDMAFLVNDFLIPIMRTWGWAVPERRTFRFVDSFDMDMLDHWQIVKDALQEFNIPIDWISKTFNIPIDSEREKPAPVIVQPKPGDNPEDEPPVPTPPKKRKDKPQAGFFD